MKVALQFAIVRFMPFAETSEFANVGILAFAPKTGFVSYKLAPARFKRVSDFFDDLEGQLYKQAIANFEDELNYIQNFAKNITSSSLNCHRWRATIWQQDFPRSTNRTVPAPNAPRAYERNTRSVKKIRRNGLRNNKKAPNTCVRNLS
ncbi:DUF3037 domain-containing protein [Vibrio cyclitrophicus]